MRLTARGLLQLEHLVDYFLGDLLPIRQRAPLELILQPAYHEGLKSWPDRLAHEGVYDDAAKELPTAPKGLPGTHRTRHPNRKSTTWGRKTDMIYRSSAPRWSIFCLDVWFYECRGIPKS